MTKERKMECLQQQIKSMAKSAARLLAERDAKIQELEAKIFELEKEKRL